MINTPLRGSQVLHKQSRRGGDSDMTRAYNTMKQLLRNSDLSDRTNFGRSGARRPLLHDVYEFQPGTRGAQHTLSRHYPCLGSGSQRTTSLYRFFLLPFPVKDIHACFFTQLCNRLCLENTPRHKESPCSKRLAIIHHLYCPWF